MVQCDELMKQACDEHLVNNSQAFNRKKRAAAMMGAAARSSLDSVRVIEDHARHADRNPPSAAKILAAGPLAAATQAAQMGTPRGLAI